MPTNNPEIIYFDSFSTSIGHVYIAKNSKGVCRIFLTHAAEKDFLQLFPKDTSIKIQRNDSRLKYEIDVLKEYLAGKQVAFDFPLDLCCGTLFQKKVWEKLREIPYGEYRSYKWIAEQIGNPHAARAVGMANNKNPLPLVIPCHRVIGSNGSLTGYASGLHIKKQLLEMEYDTKNERCKL